MIKKYFLLTVLVAHSGLCTLAQSDFRQGFIISLTQDTTWGEVEYRSNAKNATSCVFKKNGDSRYCSPKEILGFGYQNDKVYASTILDSVFVEVLVSGEMSLYKYDFHYFVKKVGGEIVKLQRNFITIDRNGTEVTKEDFRWKGVLKAYLGTCPFEGINSISLADRELTRVVVDYNICRAANYRVYKASKPWSRVLIGLSAGIASSTLNVDDKSTKFDYFPDKDMRSINPFVGIQLEVSSPRISERASVLAEFHFMKSSYSASLTRGTSTNLLYYNTEIELSVLSVPIMFRYALPGKKITPFATAGFTYDRILNSKAEYTREHVAYNTITVTKGKAFDPDTQGIGFAAGVGVVKPLSNKLSAGFLFRYVKGMRLNHDYVHALTVRNNRMLLSLTLQRR